MVDEDTPHVGFQLVSPTPPSPATSENEGESDEEEEEEEVLSPRSELTPLSVVCVGWCHG